MGDLEKLLVDERALDRDALGAALLPYVRVGNDGTFRPASGWGSLGKAKRVVAVLLATKAAHVLGVRPGEAITAAEVAALSGVPGNTSRPALRGLVQRSIAGQDPQGRYFIPNMAVPDAIVELGATED